MKILVFDTETSGLPPQETMNNSTLKYKLLAFNEELWSKYLESWPELLQLTYFIYDDDKSGKVEKIYDNYVEISSETMGAMEKRIQDLYSIGKDHSANILQGNLDRLSRANKKTICDVVCDFLNDVKKCDVVVGHNINFDILMMISSAKKALLDEKCRDTNCKNLDTLIELLKRDNLNKVCTMKDGTEVCEIPSLKKTGEVNKIIVDIINEQGEKVKVEKVKFKPPKLIELFNKLFNKDIDESKLHDSKYDVLITLLVYLKLKNPSFTLPNTSNILNTITTMTEYYNLLNNITMKIGGKRKFKKKSIKNMKKNKKTKKKNIRKRKQTLHRRKY